MFLSLTKRLNRSWNTCDFPCTQVTVGLTVDSVCDSCQEVVLRVISIYSVHGTSPTKISAQGAHADIVEECMYRSTTRLEKVLGMFSWMLGVAYILSERTTLCLISIKHMLNINIRQTMAYLDEC